MTYYCNHRDESIMNKSKHNHLKSITHKKLDGSIIRRYIILVPNISENEELMKRCINICNKEYERYSSSCDLKVLTTTNRLR